MSTELVLNFLGIRMDSHKAERLQFTINLVTPDTGEAFIAEMENATLTNVKGFQAENSDLILTNDRSDLEADDDGRQDSRGRPSVAPHTWPAPASWTADMSRHSPAGTEPVLRGHVQAWRRGT